MAKFEQIECFIRVVEENNFAAAAKQLAISPAAVSRKIAALENDLGMQLLTRSTRLLRLTPIGERYYQECKIIFERMRDLENLMAESQEKATGILHVTSNRHFANTHLIPGLPQFLTANPDLKVKLDVAERFPDFHQENVDILFGVSIDGPPELVRKRICTTRYVLCAAPAYLKQYGTPTVPNDLLSHRYITHALRTPLDILLFKGGKEIFVEPYLSLNDASAMLECALLGLGIIKLHDYVVAKAIQEGKLIELLPQYAAPEYPVYLYYQQSRYLTAKIRKFIDFYVPT